MKLFFNYYGDFSQYTKEDLCFGAIQFISNGKQYVVDLVGEVDYDFSKTEIIGLAKCELEVLEPEEPITDEELKNAIINMDTSTFQYNILDDGEEPAFRKFEGEIWIEDKAIEIEQTGTQSMKVRDLFDILRKYPDWDKDIVIENQKTKMLDDIVDIVCDERNGNLIIVKRDN